VLAAQVQQARLSFGYARIVAPVDGHVAQRKAAIGTYVSPGQQMLALLDVQNQIAQTRLALGQSTVSLFKALGGGRDAGTQ
jgi:multidrug resistance efflux pump